MKNSKFLIALFITFSLGCSNRYFYQIIETRSASCNQNEQFIFTENEDISVLYTFWEEGGTLGLYVKNVANKPIYVDWKKSSLIIDGLKNDLWVDEKTVVSIGENQSDLDVNSSDANFTNWYSEFTKNNKQLKIQSSNAFYSISRITTPERATFIPPESVVMLDKYYILEHPLNIDNFDRIIDTTLYFKTFNNPAIFKRDKKIKEIIFKKEHTPLNFRSFITYSFDEDFSDEKYIDCSFYISKVLEFEDDVFKAHVNKSDFDGQIPNMWAKANRFYIIKTAK